MGKPMITGPPPPQVPLDTRALVHYDAHATSDEYVAWADQITTGQFCWQARLMSPARAGLLIKYSSARLAVWGGGAGLRDN